MLNPKQTKCIEMLASGQYTQVQIAKELKISEQTICNWKKNNEFATELTEKIRICLQTLAPKAIHTMEKLLNSESDNVRFSAAKDILDRTGFKPQDRIEVQGAVNNPFEGLTTEELRKIIDDE
ncbi:MAG: phBC6A51 family helix-turn-helix protein [Ruminococcus sp.]|nr:phBC6A51 family helix-turn-helix protein [Ruminococcus sp.]